MVIVNRMIRLGNTTRLPDGYHFLALCQATTEGIDQGNPHKEQNIRASQAAAVAVALRPRVGKFRNTYGEALRRGGELKRGIAQLYEAVRCEPRSPGSNGNLASLLQSLGMEREAYGFRKAQLEHSKKPVTRHLAYIDVGISAFALQHTQEAIEVKYDANSLNSALALALALA